MLTNMQVDTARVFIQASSQQHDRRHGDHKLHNEAAWRQHERNPSVPAADITVSRWQDARAWSRHEAATPSDGYHVAIALKATCLTLTKGRQIIFDGAMPAGTLYVSTPSEQLGVVFQAPCAFLHFHIPIRLLQDSAEDLNHLVLLRDPLVGQLAKALADRGDSVSPRFARCIGETVAMHMLHMERPRPRMNALPKWRLQRVDEYIATRYDRVISLSDLAKAAGLSKMHFAAQFRVATGFRPREYILNHRVAHAKLLLSTTDTSLVQVALAVGFSTQAHFTTVFKRFSGQTPGRWRCDYMDQPPQIGTASLDRLLTDDVRISGRLPRPRAASCEIAISMG